MGNSNKKKKNTNKNNNNNINKTNDLNSINKDIPKYESKNKNVPKEKILNHIENFKNNFGTDLEDDFFEESKFEMLFENKLKKPQKIVLNKNKKLLITEINNCIQSYYEYIINNFNYNTKNLDELGEMMPKFLNLLCNIVYLIQDINQNYLEETWVKMHMKLMNICYDFNSTEKLYILMKNDHHVYELQYLLTLFCLCLSKDKDFNQRIKLLLKFPYFLYKILVICATIINVCCCGHGYNQDDNNLQCSCTQSIYLIFETFSYIENNNKQLLNEVKKVKIKYLKYLAERLGKNIAVVILLQMAKMCSTYDMFNYLINETDLMETLLNKNNDDFNHCVDKFEQFMHYCKEPEFLFRILGYISPPEVGLKKRIYYEIVKVINELVDNIDVNTLEKSVYKNEIFDKFIEILKLDIYLGDYLGIWKYLLNNENEKIVEIFSRNIYNIGVIFMDQIDNLIKNKLFGIRPDAVIEIMNLFLKMGDKIKKKYNKNNDYIEQLKPVYDKIKTITFEDNDNDNEDKSENLEEFNKYFEN